MSKLDKVFEAIPDAGCRGLCAESCSFIPVGPAEAARLGLVFADLEPFGKGVGLLPQGADGRCSFLVDNRCSRYEDRPAVCRLFAVVKAMRCRHGCKPTGGFLKPKKARRLLNDAITAGVGT